MGGPRLQATNEIEIGSARWCTIQWICTDWLAQFNGNDLLVTCVASFSTEYSFSEWVVDLDQLQWKMGLNWLVLCRYLL